jgi:hypothetical protein
MQLVKKEWRTILIILWLVLLTVLLVRISGQLVEAKAMEARIASTLDSVESIVLSTDAGVVQVHQKTGAIESNVDFIVERIRRR